MARSHKKPIASTVSRPVPSKSRRPSLEVVERFATISMAFLGFLAFAWQVREQVGSRTEIITVETEEPELTLDGDIRLPINVINHSDRAAYIRNVLVNQSLSDSTSSGGSLSFAPDSVIKIEPGGMAHYSASSVPILRAVSLSQSPNIFVHVKTTRKSHRLPISFRFSAATLNTISLAAGGAPVTRALDNRTASALRERIAAECRTLVSPLADTVGVWRDSNGGFWIGGRSVEGGMRATEFICAGIADAALADSIKQLPTRR
jgi:hypothetical protein